MIPVAAGSLHQRRVELRDARLSRASLFPFFDRRGEIKVLMLVWPLVSDIVLLPLEPLLVKVPWWGPVRVRLPRESLADSAAEHAAELAGDLWHYDPWWVLREDRFAGHPAVPVLKATNCAEVFPEPVLGCYFERDLSRIVGFATHAEDDSGEHKLTKFVPEWLPEHPGLETNGRPRRRDWQLAPFWHAQDWNRSPRTTRKEQA